MDIPLDWIGISPGGMPAVKDASGELGTQHVAPCGLNGRALRLHISAVQLKLLDAVFSN